VTDVMALVASGTLKVRVSAYPLSDAARAYRDLEGRTSTGKLVLTLRP
jgi:NADPH2:quinone reductase